MAARSVTCRDYRARRAPPLTVAIDPATSDVLLATARIHVETWKTGYRGIPPDRNVAGLTYESDIVGDSEARSEGSLRLRPTASRWVKVTRWKTSVCDPGAFAASHAIRRFKARSPLARLARG